MLVEGKNLSIKTYCLHGVQQHMSLLRNWDLPRTCIFLWGRLREQSVLAVGCHSSLHTCKDNA